MIFRKFDHLLTTRPHDIHAIFISDLHLEEKSNLQPAFLALLDDLLALPSLKKLYILGDWFEVWIGDDYYLDLSAENKANHWITPIIKKLKQLTINGCQIFILTGNRDFLMRQPFCNAFGGKLVAEPYFIDFNNKKIRLEHGDALCTDDKNYQKLRKYMHNRFIQWGLLNCSIATRLKIADKLRNTSKQANSNKSMQIMDVNQKAVKTALQQSDILIHGHTHCPNIHKIGENKIRYVLGDWRITNNSVNAILGVIYQDEGKQIYEMMEFQYQTK